LTAAATKFISLLVLEKNEEGELLDILSGYLRRPRARGEVLLELYMGLRQGNKHSLHSLK
ncbi:hypothetical protein HAX54_015714, partial [Datura stramonium]|nr:hypothetical protein [Datura stramonium]